MAKDLMSLSRSTNYPLDAFLFIQRGLDYAVRRTHGEADPKADPASRHVSGQQLCEGLRDYAIAQYGLLARSVLRHWHINRCEDFGRIVFAMIEAGMMQKTSDDTLDDFVGVYDFAEAFAPNLQLTGDLDPR
jgi:uncharacterized repeat protein (TIGR04138 family)